MGSEACARLLLENGAVVDHTNKYGQTALMFACSSGHEPLVRLLVEYGASRTAVDAEGRVAADFASRRKHLNLASWIESVFLRGVSRSPSRSPSQNARMPLAEPVSEQFSPSWAHRPRPQMPCSLPKPMTNLSASLCSATVHGGSMYW